MISFKVLVILAVIIDLICCNHQKEVDECKATLKTIGFSSMSGFYNYNFIRQFYNFNEFAKYVKEKMKYKEDDAYISDATSTKPSKRGQKRKRKEMADDDETLPENLSYLRRFYNGISKLECVALLMTPIQFCSYAAKNISLSRYRMIAEKGNYKQGIIDSDQGNSSQGDSKQGVSGQEITAKKNSDEEKSNQGDSKQGGSDLEMSDPENSDQENSVKEFRPKKYQLDRLIALASGQNYVTTISTDAAELFKYQYSYLMSCKKAIIEFELKHNGEVYKYEEDNKYKNIITSYNLAMMSKPKKDSADSLDLKFNTLSATGYMDYNLSVFGNHFTSMSELKSSTLCKNHFSKNNFNLRENENLQQGLDDINLVV